MPDPAGKSFCIVDTVAPRQRISLADVPDLLVAKAYRDGLSLHPGATRPQYQLIPLPSEAPPPAGDTRPQAAWAVSVYIVAHDVKFSGYGRGVFLWPYRPAGVALAARLDVLVANALTPVFLEPAHNIPVEFHNVTVAAIT